MFNRLSVFFVLVVVFIASVTFEPLVLAESNKTTVSFSQGIVRFVVDVNSFEHLRIEVFNLSGQRIFDSGVQRLPIIEWKMQGLANWHVATGVYLYLTRVEQVDGNLQTHLNKLVIGFDQIALLDQTEKPDAMTPLAACSTYPISSDQRLPGTLSRSDCKTPGGSYQDWYTFVAVAGEQATIAMNSSEFDTYVYLDKPDGSNLNLDDDAGEGQNSLISNQVLPVTGTYKIRATSFGRNVRGAYTVSLTIKSPPILVNPPIEAQISRNACATNDQYFVMKVKRDSTLQFFTEVEIAATGSTKIKRAFLLADDENPAGDLAIDLLLNAAGLITSLSAAVTVAGVGLALAEYFERTENNFQNVINMKIRPRMSSEVDFFVWLQNDSGWTNATLTVKWARNGNETISTKIFYLSCLRA